MLYVIKSTQWFISYSEIYVSQWILGISYIYYLFTIMSEPIKDGFGLVFGNGLVVI